MLAAERLHGARHAGGGDRRADAGADSGRAGRRFAGCAADTRRAALAGEQLEKMALELLWTEESKQKLLEAARNVIEKYGFAIELADVQLMQDKTEIVDAIETEVHLHLTEKMETDILDALAGYLKESVMGQSPVLSEEE